MCQVDSEAQPRHVYWLLGKERTEFSVEDCDAKGRREVLWTGVRGNEDVRNLTNVRQGDVLYLCESGLSPAITAILEAVGDPVPDATAWDAEFSKKHWVTKPDRVMPGCSIGNNPYWAVQVKLVWTLEQRHAELLSWIPTVKAFRLAVPLAELAQMSCWTVFDVHNGQVTQLSEDQWDAVIEHASG